MPFFHSIAWVASNSGFSGSHFGSTSGSFEGVGTGNGAGIAAGAGEIVIAAGAMDAGCTAMGKDAGPAVMFIGFKKVAGTIVLLLAVSAGFIVGWIIVDRT